MSVLFAREGADVVVADKDHQSAMETIKRAASDRESYSTDAELLMIGNPALGHNRTLMCMKLDVADSAAIEHAIASVASSGKLDGLVYNVGIGVGEPWLSGATVESWDKVFAVNLRGAMLTLKAALPVMDDGSSIVLISSIASMKPGSRLPAYDASKAALGGLMRHAGIEGERRGIRVNIVAPGLMDTSIGRAATQGRPGRENTPVPLGRQGTGWETAYAALFLLSDEAAYITGQTLAVDGGMTGLR